MMMMVMMMMISIEPAAHYRYLPDWVPIRLNHLTHNLLFLVKFDASLLHHKSTSFFH